MGEIADGLINGDFCSETGEYLGEGLGFPRTSNGSFQWEISDKSKRNGIQKFLEDRGFKPNTHTEYVRKYYTIVLQKSKNYTLTKMCVNIQDDGFIKFKNWFISETCKKGK